MNKVVLINNIIDEYQKQGYKLTLRQLYYQLVSRDLIPNKVQEYAKLSALLVKARMSGMVDWNAIEDRLRVPKLPYWVTGIQDAIDDTISQYRLNRQAGQPKYVEVMVEKDALSNVLYRVTSKYHIRLMVNRGYSSCTAMHDTYMRMRGQGDTRPLYILYLGDHDPSGLDMIRDVRERLEEFGCHIDMHHLAITKNQIAQYNPPPNPAKISDPRARWYINQHGATSWEVDALPPNVLHNVLENAITSLIDMNMYNHMVAQEDIDKEKLTNFAAFLKKSEDEDEDEDEDGD